MTDAQGVWPLLDTITYQAECPGGGHDADWTCRCYGKPASIASRTIATHKCAVCP